MLPVSRHEIKSEARSIASKYKNKVVLPVVVIFAASGVISSLGSKVIIDIDNGRQVITTISRPGGDALSLFLMFFAFIPLSYGVLWFFKNLRKGADYPMITSAFSKEKYWKVVENGFWIVLEVALWLLLLIVPGVIKSYELRFVPYILDDNPDISREEAFSMSKAMTDGHKKDLFVIDLSFLGWILLSILSLGILYIFYVGPYMYITQALVYEKIKDNEVIKSYYER